VEWDAFIGCFEVAVVSWHLGLALLPRLNVFGK